MPRWILFICKVGLCSGSTQVPRRAKLNLGEDLTSRFFQLPNNFLGTVMDADFFTHFWKALYEKPLTN